MDEQYKWNYKIKVRTKEGTFECEDKLDSLENILEKHPDYEMVHAVHTKKLVKQKPIVGRKK